MADIVSLRNEPIQTADLPLLARLKDLVERIESGEIKPEKYLLLVVKTSPKNPAMVCTESFDSGLTLSEAVYLMSGGIHDLHEAARA